MLTDVVVIGQLAACVVLEARRVALVIQLIRPGIHRIGHARLCRRALREQVAIAIVGVRLVPVDGAEVRARQS